MCTTIPYKEDFGPVYVHMAGMDPTRVTPVEGDSVVLEEEEGVAGWEGRLHPESASRVWDRPGREARAHSLICNEVIPPKQHEGIRPKAIPTDNNGEGASH